MKKTLRDISIQDVLELHDCESFAIVLKHFILKFNKNGKDQKLVFVNYFIVPKKRKT